MKYTNLIISITLALLFTSIVNSSVKASEDKLYTQKKHPYDLLLARTDTVKIIYTEDKEQVNCKVEVNWKNEQITSEQVSVNKVAFNKEPLASCLSREKAKNILAKTFDYL